jgi:hypothetical protein
MNLSCTFTKVFGVRSKLIVSPADGTASLVNQPGNMPRDFARKWTGGDCDLRR